MKTVRGRGTAPLTLACIAIPLLPLVASVAIVLGGPWLKGRSHFVALPAVCGAFALSVAALVHVVLLWV